MHWFIESLAKNDLNRAIIHEGKVYNYLWMRTKIKEYINELKNQDILPGSIVALCSDYSPNSIAMLLALLENKNITIPLVSQIKEELQRKISISNAEWLINVNERSVDRKPISILKPDHPLLKKLKNNKNPGLILFSSGSTGEPKGMVHDFNKLLDPYKNRSGKKLNILIFMGFDHIGGLDTLFRALSIGGTLTIAQDRSPKTICNLIEKYKVDVLPVTPTFLNLFLLDESYKRYDLSTLKVIGYGAEPMSAFLLEKVRKIFPNVKLQQKFGTSETSAIRIKNVSPESLYFKIDDENTKYKIINDELWLKSSARILGYLNDSSNALDDKGWFHTGDLVETGADGSIKIVGRLKGVINVGGEKVNPEEVEAVLSGVEEIKDSLVYGEENPITGQIVVADVVAVNDIAPKVLKKIIRKYCQSRLENYKIPVKIVKVAALDYGKRMKKIRHK